MSCVALRHTDRRGVAAPGAVSMYSTHGGTYSRTHHIIRLPSLSSAVSIARLAVKIGTPIEYLPEYREYLGAPARVLTGTR